MQLSFHPHLMLQCLIVMLVANIFNTIAEAAHNNYDIAHNLKGLFTISY